MSESVLTVAFTQLNRSDYTLRSYRSLVENTTLPTDLIIVDAGSDKEHFDKLSECISTEKIKVTIVPLRSNISIGFHKNVAIRMCHTPLLLAADNDMDYTPGWDTTAARLLYASGADLMGLWRHPFHGQIEDLSPEWDNMNAIPGNCWFSKGSDIYRELGWVKETPAPCGGEDVEFIIRMRENGYKAYSTKNNLITHFGAVRSDGTKGAEF